MKAFFALALGFYHITGMCGQGSPCTPTMRSMFPSGCVAYIQQAMADPNLYWFGSLLEPLCQSKPSTFSECVSFKVNGTLRIPTLGGRLFAPTAFNPYTSLSTLRAIPAVVYNATAGQFNGCNTTQQLLNDMYFEIYPGMPAVTPYMVKDTPRVIAPGCSATQLCTLIFFDAGIGVLHNIWSDWNGTAPLLNYNGPGIGIRNPNPYIWVYFYQNPTGTVGATTSSANSIFTFNIVDFQRQNNLTGPIGLTWLNVVGDVYGEKNLRDGGIMQNCPALLVGTLLQDPTICQNLGLGPIPELDAWLGVMFTDMTMDVWTDAIANGVIGQSATTNSPQILMDPRTAPPVIATDLPGQYMLIFVEVSNLYYPTYGMLPLTVHWLVINTPITQTIVPPGTTAIPYSGSTMAPTGLAMGPKQNYALVFRQNGGLVDQTTLTTWIDQRGCTAAANFTCIFAMQDLMSTANLTLVAINRWRVV